MVSSTDANKALLWFVFFNVLTFSTKAWLLRRPSSLQPKSSRFVSVPPFTHRSIESVYGYSSTTGQRNMTFNIPAKQKGEQQHGNSSQNFVSLNLTTDQVNNCFGKSSVLRVSGSGGYITLTVSAKQKLKLIKKSRTCQIVITVSRGKLVYLERETPYRECPFSGDWMFYDTESEAPLFQTKCGFRTKNLHGVSNSITILIKVTVITPKGYTAFSFKEISADSRDTKVIFRTSTSGFIQSAGFDSQAMYPPLLDSKTRLLVPTGLAVMLSVLFVEIDINLSFFAEFQDHVKVYNDNYTCIYHISRSTGIPKPVLLQTDFLLIHFVTDTYFDSSRNDSKGFKMLFSFHNHTAIPQQVQNGKWNCSVSYWTEFQHHFPCNIHVDCLEGEDEMLCPYTSDRCGVGFVSVGESCHIHIESSIRLSWNQAELECQHRGGSLSSLNTDQELETILSLAKLIYADSVFIGLTSTHISLPNMYRKAYQWIDGTIAYRVSKFIQYTQTAIGICGYLADYQITFDSCTSIKYTKDYFCEMQPKNVSSSGNALSNIKSPVIYPPKAIRKTTSNITTVQCPANHLTHTFLACDVYNACWGRGLRAAFTCGAPLVPNPPHFTCGDQTILVPFTLVCDHRQDCSDGSDEDFCSHTPCNIVFEYECRNKQCTPKEAICDGVNDCATNDDENDCPVGHHGWSIINVGPPAIINFDIRVGFTVQKINDAPLNNSEIVLCPETHFQCFHNGYCLPVYVRCNTVTDCPGHEDEAGCESYTCDGFYRCRKSKICLHPDHLCDTLFQCPEGDDEMFCKLSCPTACLCYGWAFYCNTSFLVGQYKDVRFLEASGTSIRFDDVENNTMLVYLRLSQCKISQIQMLKLPNLNLLDVSFNNIKTINWPNLRYLKHLKQLSLAGNPLEYFISGDLPGMENLLILDISDPAVKRISLSVREFSVFPRLQIFNLSNSGIDNVLDDGFQQLTQLQQLDIRGCPLSSFKQGVFKGLSDLQMVYADNYKLCCPLLLPEGFNQQNCLAPSDEISSCDSLLRSNTYRVILFLFATFSLLGNCISFVYRVFIQTKSQRQAFGVFVTHLTVSDFFMGVYQASIGIADRLYQGTYLWQDISWRHSITCRASGFLSLLSTEVSAFIISLITLDRFLVLRFPFSGCRFRCRSAHVSCSLAWVVGIVLAALPLLPVNTHWFFYSQTGICIPLPITQHKFAGDDYSFAVLIIFNFVWFALIGFGQVSIYMAIRSNTLSCIGSSQKANDMTIARRLITVAMSDFLCWFPIGLLGIMASAGTAVPGEINVAIAIMVLPLNAVLNPFLYTINMITEARRKQEEQRLMKLLRAELHGKAGNRGNPSN